MSFLRRFLGGSDQERPAPAQDPTQRDGRDRYRVGGPGPDLSQVQPEATSVLDQAEEQLASGDRDARKEAVLAVAEAIPHQDAIYEQLANGLYGGLPEHVIEGFGYEVAGEVEDSSTSFTAKSYAPRSDLDADEKAALEQAHGRPLVPVAAFKGTKEIAADMATNLNEEGVGAWQFRRNIGNIAGLLQAGGGKADVTGHSLGGALAQWTAAELSSQVLRVVTFQAPGISQEAVDQLEAYNLANPDEAIDSTHYEAKGDPLSDFGQARTRGDVYQADIVGTNGIWNHRERILSNLVHLRDTDDKHLFRNTAGAELSDRLMDLDKTHTDDIEQGSLEGLRGFVSRLADPFTDQDERIEQWEQVEEMAESGAYSLARIEAVIDLMDMPEHDKGQLKANLRVTWPELD